MAQKPYGIIIPQALQKFYIVRGPSSTLPYAIAMSYAMATTATIALRHAIFNSAAAWDEAVKVAQVSILRLATEADFRAMARGWQLRQECGVAAVL